MSRNFSKTRPSEGKRVFVSGGPGRVIGLLHALNDYEMNIEVACMFWPHFWSRKDLAHLLRITASKWARSSSPRDWTI